MPRILPRRFYLDPPEIVGPALLGKLLVRRIGAHRLTGRIVEVEAYQAGADPAAHAFAGRTPRNDVLFGPPGHAYLYFIYGMHYCLNVSCEPKGQAGCLLIRALEPVAGLDEMARLRGLSANARPKQLTSGPGRLCQAFGLTRPSHNGADFTSRTSDLQIVDDGASAGPIAVSARVGITKAADRPLRFYLQDNPFVSTGPRLKA